MQVLVRIGSCKAGDKLSNDTKYVMIRYILTKLIIFKHTKDGTNRN